MLHSVQVIRLNYAGHSSLSSFLQDLFLRFHSCMLREVFLPCRTSQECPSKRCSPVFGSLQIFRTVKFHTEKKTVSRLQSILKTRRGTDFMDWHLNIEAILGYLRLFKSFDAGNTTSRLSTTQRGGSKCTHYARRLCISVIGGTRRALEKGFQRLMRSHQPETVSPKFLGELSSSLSLGR